MITINTKDTGETTVHIIAATLAEAIQQLDRARAALWELDEVPQPLGAATGGMPTAAELEQITTLLAPTTADTLTPQEQPSDPALPPPPIASPSTATQVQNSDSPSVPSVLSAPYLPSTPPTPTTLDELHPEIATVGQQLFGEDWSRAATWIVSRWTVKRTPTNIRNSIDSLNTDECMTILQGMIDHAAETKAEWQKHLQHEAAKAQPAPQRPQPAQRRVHGRQPRNNTGSGVPSGADATTRRPPTPPTPAQIATAANPVYATG